MDFISLLKFPFTNRVKSSSQKKVANTPYILTNLAISRQIWRKNIYFDFFFFAFYGCNTACFSKTACPVSANPQKKANQITLKHRIMSVSS